MHSKHVAHLTSVHSRYDIRIFVKECRSLVSAGYRVSLIVADGEGNEFKSGLQICDVGREPGRLRRMTITSRRMLARCLEVDADIYHLHDPELLAISGSLRRAGKVVIFDAHEDGPAQILGKSYLHPVFRRFLSKVYGAYEARVCRNVDAVVTATSFIRDKFVRINPRSVDINNYPLLDELFSSESDRDGRKNQVCYVGGISEHRGIRDVVEAMGRAQSGASLKLCGRFAEKSDESEVKTHPGWKHVDEAGWLERGDIRDVLRDSVAGLVTFHPLPNHVDAQPNKMFEYMSAAVPVIASDFPLWREIVEGNDCGICVNPQQPQAIADAIDFLVRNPDRARQMGANGWQAVQERYNWSIEEQKLFDLYEQLGNKV